MTMRLLKKILSKLAARWVAPDHLIRRAMRSPWLLLVRPSPLPLRWRLPTRCSNLLVGKKLTRLPKCLIWTRPSQPYPMSKIDNESKFSRKPSPRSSLFLREHPIWNFTAMPKTVFSSKMTTNLSTSNFWLSKSLWVRCCRKYWISKLAISRSGRSSITTTRRVPPASKTSSLC